ncbi:MAG TPA: hypothetical protein VGR69_00650 [Candidatus Rubrimentiphilum sp.]|nr:hypothetical protein [Candidatus Rubrimentiphilum sp.]
MGRETPTAALLALRVTTPIARATWLTLQFRSLSIAAVRSCAQSSGTLSLQHELGRNILGNVQLGTAFNEAGRSKAHYLGFGFTFQP